MTDQTLKQLKEENIFLKEQNEAIIGLLDLYELFQYYHEQLYLKRNFTETARILLDYIEAFFRSRTQAICTAVYLVKEDGLTFDCAVLRAPEATRKVFDKELFVQADKGVVAWSINNKKLSFVESLCNPEFKSIIIIPLFGIRQLFGLIFIYINSGVDEITQEVLKIVNSSCLQAGLYIDNLMAYEKLKEYGQNMEKLVDERTRELWQKNQELKASNEVKSNFISSVSHELRTPLTSILGFSKVILKDMKKFNDALPENYRKQNDVSKFSSRMSENAEIIISESLRLTRLINEVLDLAKIESGKVVWDDQVWDFRTIVEEGINIVQGFFLDNTKVDFITEVAEGDLGKVMLDKDKIIQVISNLISNSIKFTDSGYIKIRAWREDGYAQLEVSDTGRGISKEDQKKIFKKFIQVGDTLTDKPQGTGLGLAISKEIIEHYKGKIWVGGDEGKGSIFHFVLPAVRASLRGKAKKALRKR